MTSGEKLGRRFDCWLDECKMALTGTILATRDPRFWAGFLLTFFIFGTLMNLLSGSTAALNLFWATDFGGKLAILGDAFLANFGVGKSFWDFLLTFLISILQSTLIGLVVLVWRHKKASKSTKTAKTTKTTAAQLVNSSNVQDASLAAAFAILGSGCPTCGTTLLAPVVSAFFSSGSFALAGFISGFLTLAAVLLALFALKRIGRDAYVMILSARYARRHGAQSSTKSAPSSEPASDTKTATPAAEKAANAKAPHTSGKEQQ